MLIILGIFSLLSKEINLTILGALLTIVGYSLNDTIVVFDRIRENLRQRKRGEAYDEVRNNLDALEEYDAAEAVGLKVHYGAPGGLDLELPAGVSRETRRFVRRERKKFHGAISDLLGVDYTELK